MPITHGYSTSKSTTRDMQNARQRSRPVHNVLYLPMVDVSGSIECHLAQPLTSAAAVSAMCYDVDDVSVGVAEEEAAHPPRFVGRRMNYLQSFGEDALADHI